MGSYTQCIGYDADSGVIVIGWTGNDQWNDHQFWIKPFRFNKDTIVDSVEDDNVSLIKTTDAKMDKQSAGKSLSDLKISGIALVITVILGIMVMMITAVVIYVANAYGESRGVQTFSIRYDALKFCIYIHSIHQVNDWILCHDRKPAWPPKSNEEIMVM